MEDELHGHDRGLAYDLGTLLDRRRTLKLLAGAGVLAFVGCSSGQKATSATSTSVAGTTPTTGAGSPTSTPATATGVSCETIPTETAGPFPGDGSNGPNVLTQSGIVRSDVTSSFGSMTGVATGIPLTVNLTIVDSGSSCAPLAARRSTCGTATSTATTRCTRRAPLTRTT